MAIIATAHKFARTFYNMLKRGIESVDQVQDYYEKPYRDRVTKNLIKKACRVKCSCGFLNGIIAGTDFFAEEVLTLHGVVTH